MPCLLNYIHTFLFNELTGTLGTILAGFPSRCGELPWLSDGAQHPRQHCQCIQLASQCLRQ